MQRGDFVQTLFDTGAMGVAILHGVVIAAGPMAYRVRWESGLTNRIRQGDWRVKAAENVDPITREKCEARGRDALAEGKRS